MSATVRIIALDGVTTLRSTDITDAQAIQAALLFDAVKQARETIRFTEGQQNVQRLSGALDEIHPLTIRQLLPRLAVLLGGEAMPVHPNMLGTSAHLSVANNRSINSDAARQNETQINPIVASLAALMPSGDYLGFAVTIGALLLNQNQPFDRVELVGGATTTVALRWR
jgi:hypothetical protein